MRRNLKGWLCGLFLVLASFCQAADIDPANATPPPPEANPSPSIAPDADAVPGSTLDPFASQNIAPTITPEGSTLPAVLGTGADQVTTEAISAAARRSALLPADDVEIRGLEVLSSVNGFQTQDQVRELVDQVVSAGFNRVYPEVRTAYGVAIQSRTEAQLPFISTVFPNPAAEIKTKLSGTAKIFPLINVLPAYSAITGLKPLPDNILAKFPAFRNQSVTGDFVAPDNQVYLDPGSTTVQDYLAAILLEIDTQILPDGYLLSGVSYPGKDWGYSERAVSEFRSIVGGSGPPAPDDPTWAAYRRDQLTKLLRRLKSTVTKDRPFVKFSVLIPVKGAPPASWEEWQNSSYYADHMQDWIQWCREGIVDEIVLEVHEKLSPEGNVLEDWANFLTSNVSPARPVVSLAGGMNFNEALVRQYQLVRSRGVGTILYHYAAPTRSGSRGFFQSLPNTTFNVPPGKGLPPKPLLGTSEFREFSRMINPPPAYVTATQTAAASDPLKGGKLVLATPSPVPTLTPVPRFVPEAISRRITLTSGVVVEAVILEVTPTSLKIQAPGTAPMEFARDRVSKIEPAL
ncbi:family 10 glycosylhydrolase [Candidatus Sumerlaeota bacterium]|nr:family 10 glycosylhydrolase [Candidatus Sumerlaeota bacterium]